MSMNLRPPHSVSTLLERYLSFKAEELPPEDHPLLRRSRAFALVMGAFMPASGLSLSWLFHDWRPFPASLVALGLLGLAVRFGHLGGGRYLRALVHVTIASMLALTTLLAVEIGNGSALSVTYPSVLILATCYLLGSRATLFWTVASIGCLAYVVLTGGAPPSSGEGVLAGRVDVFVSRSIVLSLICAFSIVERRFSDNASRKLQYLARHDSLTGLLNRRALEEHLAQTLARCRRYERRFALLFIDLDGFKRINDELGHAPGDRLLAVVGERIRSMTRETDAAARMGGDEFTVVIEDYDEQKGVGIYAERLFELLARPVDLGENTIDPSASIGIARFPDDGATAEAILHAADFAMYAAKATGGGCLRFFEGPASNQ